MRTRSRAGKTIFLKVNVNVTVLHGFENSPKSHLNFFGSIAKFMSRASFKN